MSDGNLPASAAERVQLRSFDNRINELSSKINEIPLTQTIEEKERDVLQSVEELGQLQEAIRTLFNEIIKKIEDEKDEETIGKLKDILSKIKDDYV